MSPVKDYTSDYLCQRLREDGIDEDTVEIIEGRIQRDTSDVLGVVIYK